MLAEIGRKGEVVVHPVDGFTSRETVLVYFETSPASLARNPHAEGKHDFVPLL